MNIGVLDEFTMLNYLEIEAINSPTNSNIEAPQLQITQGTNYKVTANWNNSNNATGYKLFYAPEDVSYINSIDLGTNIEISVNLYSQAAFYVAIQAYNEDGNTSDYSNIEFFKLYK
jgi:hypothetical protein